MKHILFGKVPVIALMTFAIVTLTTATFVGGTVLADSADVDDSASPRLIDTGTISSQIKSFARYQLQVDEGARLSLRVAAPVEVTEVAENGLYDSWVTTQHSNSPAEEERDDEEADEQDGG